MVSIAWAVTVWGRFQVLLVLAATALCRKLRVASIGVLAAAVLATGATASEPPYLLGPQDKLRLYVHEWPMLTGEFAVGPDGDLALPLLGFVDVRGRDLPGATALISELLQKRLKSTTGPDVTLEIVEYRPFYILGVVEKPGEYAFRPGLSVLAAVGVAGGVYRPREALGWTVERDNIKLLGEFEDQQRMRVELLVQEARLKAEAEGDETITFSKALLSDPRAAELVGKERQLFEIRLAALNERLRISRSQIDLLTAEISSLEAQIKIEDRQLALVSDEIQDLRGLVNRGLAPAPRLLPLERSANQIQREQRELETLVVRAKQQIKMTEGAIATVWNERQETASTELRQVRSRLAELEEKNRTTRSMVSEISSYLGQSQSGALGQNLTLAFSVVRSEDGVEREFAAAPTSRLKPGDILNVHAVSASSRQVAEAETPAN